MRMMRPICPFRIGDTVKVMRGEAYGGIEYNVAVTVYSIFWFNGDTRFHPGWWVTLPSGYNYQVENVELVTREIGGMEELVISMVKSAKGKNGRRTKSN